MQEIWKDIPNYEGIYQISNFGNVKSLERKRKNKNGYRIVREKVLKKITNNKGYYIVGLRKNGITKMTLIHRLIAQIFIPNPNKYPIINHIDGNKLNNNINNLEWCTYQHNIKEAFRLGLNRYTYLSNFKNMPKKVLQFDRKNNLVASYNSIRKASITTNVCSNSIWLNCKGKLNHAGGYIWKFKEN